MLLVTPCTDWYLVFIGTARGNVALAASLLPVNLVLQLLLLPVFVTVFTGTAADIPLGELALSVAVILGIPLAIAAAVRLAAARAGAHDRPVEADADVADGEHGTGEKAGRAHAGRRGSLGGSGRLPWWPFMRSVGGLGRVGGLCVRR